MPQTMPLTARGTRSPQDEFERMVRVALNLLVPDPPQAPEHTSATAGADDALDQPAPPAMSPGPPAPPPTFPSPGLRPRQSGRSPTLPPLSPRSAARSRIRAFASCPDLGSAGTAEDRTPGGPVSSRAVLPPLHPLRPPRVAANWCKAQTGAIALRARPSLLSSAPHHSFSSFAPHHSTFYSSFAPHHSTFYYSF